MKTIDIKLSEIKPYDKNPRDNDGAVDAVAASIQEFGFKQPIVVDKDGVIIVGHTRYKAAQKLELDTVPVLVAKDLTDEQVKAYRLADNKTAELAGWNFNLLNIELEGIPEIDMEQFGFIEKKTAQQINECEELDVDDFDDEEFECECPRCGFRFNRS